MPAFSYKAQIYDRLPDIVSGEKSAKDVAAEIGCGVSTVVNWLIDFGVVSRRGRGAVRKLPSTAQIIVDIYHGRTPGQIATQYGTTAPAVYAALHRDGFIYEPGRVQMHPDLPVTNERLYQKCRAVEAEVDKLMGAA